MSVGAVLQASAFSVPHMIVGRYVIAFYLVSAMLHVRDSIVGGIGNGINTSIAPVWQGETSKAKTHRHRNDPQHCWLLVLELGHLCNVLCWWFRVLEVPDCIAVHLHFDLVWHCAVASRITQVCTWFIESADSTSISLYRWLVANDRITEAEQVRS